MDPIIFRDLELHETGRIAEIDRAEEIAGYYILEHKALKFISAYEKVKAFDPLELNDLLHHQQKLLEEGGKVIGAFSGIALVAVVSVERKKRGSGSNYCKMDILYVSKNYRGLNIGKHLLEESKKVARFFGAEKLYISATPTKHTIDFYLKQGAVITQEPDEELLKKEPDDIHLEMPV